MKKSKEIWIISAKSESGEFTVMAPAWKRAIAYVKFIGKWDDYNSDWPER